MKVDLLFTTHNRLAFTTASLRCLLANTNWDHVNRLIVMDDSSIDGTYEHVAREAPTAAAVVNDVIVHRIYRHSPVGAMNVYLQDYGADADWFAKVDNDTCVPPGWLDDMLGVIERDPTIELLGMEAGMTRVAGRDGDEPWDGVYGFEPSSHIGGIGLMRVAAFPVPMIEKGRFGFTEYQWHRDMRRGWITPDLPVVLLDRLPFDPWVGLSATYRDNEWQRAWPTWDPQWMEWAFGWFVNTVPA